MSVRAFVQVPVAAVEHVLRQDATAAAGFMEPIVGALRRVALQDLACPYDGVRCTDARGLWLRPQLEVLDAVVVPHAVEVVDGFAGDEQAAERFLHDENVLENVRAAWMLGHSHLDVSLPVHCPAGPGLGAVRAPNAAGGLSILRLAALAGVLARRLAARGAIAVRAGRFELARAASTGARDLHRRSVAAQTDGFLFICSTVAVALPAAALSFDQGVLLRLLALIAAAFAVAVLLVPLGRAGHVRFAVASAYSRETSGPTNGCDGSQLRDGDLSFASFVVPCGARVRFCLGRRCVVGVRRDSGPFVPGRLFDLNLGIVRRLGFASCTAWGVRTVSWSRV